MPRLAAADPTHVQRIYRESYALWGAGLTRRDYLELWHEIRATPWGRANARFYVWLSDDDKILSSLKVYRPNLLVHGTVRPSVVLGAIFTPRACRRRGHAAAAIRAVLDLGREAGASAAVLFSDIGTRYYEPFGFREIPAEEQWGPLHRPAAAAPRGWILRDAKPADLAPMVEMHEAFCRRRPFGFVRDVTHWEFVRTRAFSFFRRLNSAHVRQRWRVVECDGDVVGYLIAVEGRGEWSVREVGARGGETADMVRVLTLGAAEAARSGLRRFYAWLPPELVRSLDGWEVRSSSRRGAIPMLLPLSGDLDIAPLQVPGAVYMPYQDQF